MLEENKIKKKFPNLVNKKKVSAMLRLIKRFRNIC